MSNIHQSNRFAWADLAATESEAALAFYCGVFGWKSENTALGDGRAYTTFLCDDSPLCGMIPLTSEQISLGGNSFWTSYLQAADVAQTAAVARMAGASILVEPFELGAQGRVGILQDPSGAVFALRDGGINRPLSASQPGSICWHELHTVDLREAKSFYLNLFGWSEQKMPLDSHEYFVMSQGTDKVAGLTSLEQQALEKGAIPQWLFYVNVVDCDAVAGKAQSAGARLLSPPIDIPGVGRSAVFADPWGASVGLLAL